MKKLSLALTPLLALSLSAQAEEMVDSSRVVDLDEVTVVTQPKEVYRLRQQPVSATLLSRETIGRLGTRDLRELSSFVPSFVMPQYGSRLTSSMYVRGIGSRVNSPAVAIYSDGMPLLAKSGLNFHTYGLERIDVLRGPQGTLYGQNSEGGVVRLHSLNPMNYQGTDITLSAGSHMHRQAEVAHYARLSNVLGLSVAGFYGGQNGFWKNNLGQRADQMNEGGGRLRLLWKPIERLAISYVGDYQYTNQNGFPYGVMSLTDGTTASPEVTFQPVYRRNMFNTSLNVAFEANAFDFNSITSYQYLRDYMLMDQDYMAANYLGLEQRQLQNALTQEFSLKSRRPVGGFWNWTAGAFFSAQWLKTNSPVMFGPAMNAFLSQQITSYAYNGMVNAMAARYISQGLDAEAARQRAETMVANAGGCSIDMTMATVPGLFHTPTYNLGFFHESNFNITPNLTATLGLRYDWNHVSIDYVTLGHVDLHEEVIGVVVDAAVTSLLAHQEHNDFNQLLPKAGLTWRVSDNGSNVYATVSKGYRAGGYNMQMFSDILQSELQANAKEATGNVIIEENGEAHNADFYNNVANTIAYKPETSWNYEAGAHLNLFGGSVQFDLSGYYMVVRNQQLSVMAGDYGFGRMMVNAGRSRSCGAEAQLVGSAFDNHLAWGASYGITHATFREYNDSTKTGKVSYEGKRVPFVPMHTMAAWADYRLDIAPTAFVRSITLGANVNGQGKTYWDEANTYSQKFYAVLGAHVDANLGAVTLSLWGRNLTSTRYNTFAVQSAATGERLTFGQLGNPFQCGIDVKMHF